MKRKTRKKLNLSSETIVRIDNSLKSVAGGCTDYYCWMSIDCDTDIYCPATVACNGVLPE